MRNTRIRATPSSPLPSRLKPRKSPGQARSRALVEAVVEAGSRILANRGWAGLTMQQVATKAGVSPGSLYQYFPDKESLVAEIVERQSKRELAFQLERFAHAPASMTVADELDAMVHAVLAFQKQEGPLMRQTLRAMPHLGRYHLLSERTCQASRAVRLLLERHRASLAVTDLDVATHVLANAIHSLTHDGVLPRPDTLDDEVLAKEINRLVCGYLGVRAVRPPRAAERQRRHA